MTTMRQRFYDLAARALEDDPRVALVLAEIGVSQLPRHPRIVNVGIREQLMIGVAAGLALEGYRPVVHSYAPFLVERPYEQIKLDLGHQDVGAVLVSTGASYDASSSGRTHQAPADVALLAALPGWTIHVPGHPDELERALRRARREPAPGTTLHALERRFAATPAAAGYVRALIDSRYREAPAHPTRAQRRGLRSELGRGGGLAGRLRAWWALPPRGR